MLYKKQNPLFGNWVLEHHKNKIQDVRVMYENKT